MATPTTRGLPRKAPGTDTRWEIRTEEETYIHKLEHRLTKVQASGASPPRRFPTPSRQTSGYSGDDSLTQVSTDDDDDGTATEVDHPSSHVGAADQANYESPTSDQEGVALLDDVADPSGAGLRHSNVNDGFSQDAFWTAKDAITVNGDTTCTQNEATGPPPLGADDSSGSAEDGDESDNEVTMTLEAKRQSIKFHDTVRIHGGIERPNKRKKKKRLPPNALPFSRVTPAATVSADTPGRQRSTASQPAERFFKDLFDPTRSSNIINVERVATSSSQPSAAVPLRTGSLAASHNRTGSTSLSSSPALLPHGHLFTSNRSRRSSSIKTGGGSGAPSFRSFAGMDGYGSGFTSVLTSATQSRSTSPASSIYAPLRIPVARAPAPFFGPTPERLAKVKEKKEAAKREAELAKGGSWKRWWFGDDTLKGKAKAVHHHHDHGDDEDGDDEDCYHDVVLEHERLKREKRMKKNEAREKRARAKAQSQWSISSGQSWLKKMWNSGEEDVEDHATSNAASNSNSRSHHHPQRGPFRSNTPSSSSSPQRGRSIGRTRSSLSLTPSPSLPNVDEGEVDIVVTLPSPFSSPPAVRNQSFQTESSPLLDSSSSTTQANITRRHPSKPKTEADVRFGPRPRRWFRFTWWRFRTWLIWQAIKQRFVAYKHAWGSWWNYDGWEGEDGYYAQV